MYPKSTRFTLRTLLVGVTLVGLLLAMVAVLLQRQIRQRRLVADLLQFDGASVFALYGEYHYAPPLHFGGAWRIVGGLRVHGFSVRDEPSVMEGILVPIFGDGAFTEVFAVYWDDTPVADADLQLLTKVPQLRELYISGTNITDACVEQILLLRNLAILDLSNTAITTNGVQKLSACSNLRLLDLSRTQIEESVVRQLDESLPNCDIEW